MDESFDPFHIVLTNRIEQAFWWAASALGGWLCWSHGGLLAAGATAFCLVMCWVSWLGGRGRRQGLHEARQRRLARHGQYGLGAGAETPASGPSEAAEPGLFDHWQAPAHGAGEQAPPAARISAPD